MADVEKTRQRAADEAPGRSNFGWRPTLENLAVLRTLVAAVGTFEDLDFDAVADLRLAVDEACTRLIRSAVPDSTLVLVVDPQDDAVVIDASTTCKSPRHPGARQLQLARAEFADRRSAHLPGRSGARGRAGVRDRHDDEASEFAAVTPSSSQGSSSRSNSEYADVADLFRELRTCPRIPRSSSGSATASSSVACRWPTTSPGDSTGAVSPATTWSRSRGWAWSTR